MTAEVEVAFQRSEAAGFLRELRADAPSSTGAWPSGGAGLPTGGDWETWFTAHFEEITLGAECPVVAEARALAAAGQARELIALDRAQNERQLGQPLAEASFRVGRRQLNRLRPLRDFRVIARYAAAVEAGEARGWHTVVYGLTLAAYDLPLLPGLVHFAGQTAAAWLDRCSREQRWPAARREHFEEQLLGGLHARLGPILNRQAGPFGAPVFGLPAVPGPVPIVTPGPARYAGTVERV